MFGIMFCFSLVGFALCLILSFMIAKSGLLFVGIIIGLVALIVMNYVVLNFIYDFVFCHKSKKSVLAVIFVVSLVVLGCGVGLSTIGVSNFDFISFDESYYDVHTEFIDMDDNITFVGYNFVFTESDDSNIKITYKNTKNCEVIKHVDENIYSFHFDYDYEFNLVKKIIHDINDRKVYKNYGCMMEVSSNKSNIQKLEKNSEKFYYHY